MTDRTTGTIVGSDELDHTEHSHDFVGAEHGEVPFSVILVHSRPGVGPKLHRHPYPEIFIMESGQTTFQIGVETVVVRYRMVGGDRSGMDVENTGMTAAAHHVDSEAP